MLYVKVENLEVDAWRLDPVVELLIDGAVGVIPTDTVYAPPTLFFYYALDRLLSHYLLFNITIILR